MTIKDSAPAGAAGDPHGAYIDARVAEFRKQLLNMTLRNPLLSCPHGPRVAAQVRVIDELPDAVFQRLERGDGYAFLPAPEPRDAPDDEDGEEFGEALADHKARSETWRLAVAHAKGLKDREAVLERLEREARDHVRPRLGMDPWEPERGLGPEDLCRRHGIDPRHDLPVPNPSEAAERHHDDALQTLLDEEELDARLRRLRDRARSSVAQTGVGTLFAAFGFLEWYESDDSDRPHHAPLILEPGELDRRLDGGRYRYTFRGTGEKAAGNLTLSRYLRQQFELELPEFGADDSPESYFAKVESGICAHRRRWRVRRFLTVGLFAYAKLAIYRDLDPAGWPEDGGLARHENIRALMAQSGAPDTSYGQERNDGGDEAALPAPIPIYDADSSQHRAIADILEGKNLAIYGPPGTGKSQTIANAIAAAAMADKTVLFVAEKLTALEVVRDRLDTAGLGMFCFNLHARGGKWREELRARVDAEPPDFDPELYERRKADWTRRRDALSTYARTMGARIGHLGDTTHDVLWRSIGLRETEGELPRAVATIDLPGAERVPAATIETARRAAARLAKALEAAPGADGASGDRHPWRGARREDLSPVDVDSALHRVEAWSREGLAALRNAAREHGLSADSETVAGLRLLSRGFGVVGRFPEAAAGCDLGALAGKEERDNLDKAVERVVQIQRADDGIRRRACVDANDPPAPEDLRALAAEAAELGVSDRSPEALAPLSEDLRRRAGERDRLDEALADLRARFGVESEGDLSGETAEWAIELMESAGDDVLAARSVSLTAREAGPIFERAERELAELERRRDELAKLFDLRLDPDPAELRRAAGDLNGLRGPLWWNGPARRAMAAYRRLTPNRSRLSSPAAVAAALARLAEYLDDRARFEADTEIADCFGDLWRGLDTDFQPIRRVVEWASRVRQALPGEGDGRAEARRTLLEGGIDRLEEIRRIAGALPPEWRAARAEPGAAAARDRAHALDALAGRARALGWSGTEPLGQAAEMAAAIGAHQSLADEAAADLTLKRVFPNGPPAAETREATLSLARAMTELGLSDAEWRRIVEIRARSRDAESIRRKLENALGREDAAWSAVSETLEVEEHEFLDGNTRSTAPFAALAARAAECGRAPAALAPWSAFVRARAEATRSHAAPILAAFEEHGVPLERLGEAYERALYRSLAQAVYARHPELRELAAGELQDHRAAFRDLEDRLQKLERERVAHELYFRPIERGESFGGPAAFTEKALIDYQLGLKRSSVSLRDLFGRARRALLQLKPCFMMSPATVAELLPRERIFDIVIVDEASQMLPCDPLGAVARARRAAIVGDPKQLPPSRFFQGGVVMDEEDDEDAASATNVESILDMALTAWRPARHLLWHYRSRHSGLIQFSNKRFYDNRLIVFPGPDEENGEAGVHYRRVEDGLYSGNRNPAEAKRVVEAACAFMKDPRNRDRSLAVVAMNLRQRDLIDEMLDREAARDRDIADYRRRWRNTLYPFIVRNLETVQGDERDVVMISTVYGPERPGGPVMQRFGPIVQAGGERRLNVLFTRARLRVEVFSSMAANDIRVDARTSEGARVLRDYLEYAATGRIDPGHGTGRATDSPFEDHVLEKLRARGLEAEPQVGVAGYRIDLGVKHPDYPHGYLLGVECDGAAYHRARSARDRDRLREAVLRDLGWDIYRVWSTDWFADPDREMAKLLAHIDRLLEKARAAPPADAGAARRGPVVEEGSEPKAEPEAPENAEDIERQGGLFANGVMLAPYRTWRGVAPDPRFASVGDVAAALLGIVEAEGPVLEGRAYRAYARTSNLQRLARQSRRALDRALRTLERDMLVSAERAPGGDGYRGALLDIPGRQRPPPRDIGPRTFEEVPLPELSAAIQDVRSALPSLDPEEVYRRILEAYGLVRMTEQVRERFEEAAASSRR